MDTSTGPEIKPRRRAPRRGGVAALALAAGVVVLGTPLGIAVVAASTPPADAPTTTVEPTTSTTAVAPAEPVTGQFGEHLAPIVSQLMADNAIPGAVVLVRSATEQWTQAFGTGTIGEDDPMTLDDHFRVGSNTKTMTGTIILQLVDEGLLRLDDPVSMYRPDVPNGENMTIAQLLDMTSGINSYTFLPYVNGIMDSDPTKAWDPEELIALGLEMPVEFQPGEGFLYSNTNTVLLGRIAEELTGEKLEDLMQERIFDPLGLKTAVMPAPAEGYMPEPYPHGYLFGTNVSTIDGAALSPEDQAKAVAGELLPNDVTDLNPSWGWAAGAASSTIGDLATYVEALVGGGLISPELQQARLDSVRGGYGLAMAKFGHMIGHNGSLPGYQSFMVHDPERDLTLIVFANIQATPAGRGAADLMAGALMGALYGE
jgi:D-alanyl-D-alanine carboxypeptidase